MDRRYVDLIRGIARKEGLDPDLVTAMSKIESSGDPEAESLKGAKGLMQMTPVALEDVNQRFGTDYDLNSMTPEENIQAGILYMKILKESYGFDPESDLDSFLAAYNSGPGATKSGKSFSYPETQRYIEKVRAELIPGVRGILERGIRQPVVGLLDKAGDMMPEGESRPGHGQRTPHYEPDPLTLEQLKSGVMGMVPDTGEGPPPQGLMSGQYGPNLEGGANLDAAGERLAQAGRGVMEGYQRGQDKTQRTYEAFDPTDVVTGAMGDVLGGIMGTPGGEGADMSRVVQKIMGVMSDVGRGARGLLSTEEVPRAIGGSGPMAYGMGSSGAVPLVAEATPPFSGPVAPELPSSLPPEAAPPPEIAEAMPPELSPAVEEDPYVSIFDRGGVMSAQGGAPSRGVMSPSPSLGPAMGPEEIPEELLQALASQGDVAAQNTRDAWRRSMMDMGLTFLGGAGEPGNSYEDAVGLMDPYWQARAAQRNVPLATETTKYGMSKDRNKESFERSIDERTIGNYERRTDLDATSPQRGMSAMELAAMQGALSDDPRERSEAYSFFDTMGAVGNMGRQQDYEIGWQDLLKQAQGYVEKPDEWRGDRGIPDDNILNGIGLLRAIEAYGPAYGTGTLDPSIEDLMEMWELFEEGQRDPEMMERYDMAASAEPRLADLIKQMLAGKRHMATVRSGGLLAAQEG